MKCATHLQPVSGEGANKGVVTGFDWQGELDGNGFTWMGEWGVNDDVVGVRWDVVFFHRFGIGDHGGGEGADSIDFAGFDQHEIVRLLSGGVGVVEGEGDDGACFRGEFGFVVGEGDGGMRFELDDDRRHLLRGCGADQGGHGEEGKERGGHCGAGVTALASNGGGGGWYFK